MQSSPKGHASIRADKFDFNFVPIQVFKLGFQERYDLWTWTKTLSLFLLSKTMIKRRCEIKEEHQKILSPCLHYGGTTVLRA